MQDVYANVMEAQQFFPMKKPRAKGLALVLNPELADAPPEYDHSYPWGLQPFDFEPDNLHDNRPGMYRYSAVDRLLSTHEEEAEICLQPLRPLSSVEAWMTALELPPNARMRRNPRFVRVLEAVSSNVKFSTEQKFEMLDAMKMLFAGDPKAAGYLNGKLPFDVPDYNPSELDAYTNYGVRGAPKVEPALPVNKAYNFKG